MNMPAFLKREAKEPVPPRLPALRPEEMRQMTMDFMNGVDRQREENAYLRSENEQLRVDLKTAKEHARMLESELAYLRDAHDRVNRHDAMMLGGLDDIAVLIVNLKERSRAEAYAPPGSGTQDTTTEGTLEHVTALEKALLPEQGKTDA